MESLDEELKKNIEKTVGFIKANGREFEAKLLNDPRDRFSFIRPENEHYEHYISLLEGTSTSDVLKNIPKQPGLFVFSEYDKVGNIPAEDIEIIKKTAEFVVVQSGEDKSYDVLMDQILLRCESREDDTFKFLNKEHKLHSTFIDFVNQYKQIQRSEKIEKLDSWQGILTRSFERAKYNEYIKQMTKKNAKLGKFYKVRFTAIDWSKFHKITEQPCEKTNILDFSELSRLKITDNKPIINAFFSKASDNVTESEANSQTKKRKKKFIVKEAGETRLQKKKMKK
ncbi:hypothetical protein KAFR_0F01510 [Kazachstania africana CBS 2517]|uniref:SURP motif domain-containing protein n=1 Tax=Kazachstania africana (strain ATCC 22294 / BCRC 22015 / CBS 2517 / CECT 1963 / NBRC 1671 / NRRL Y-8276) TaxID=1071382 RepID=H2AWJ8_KAZAF|nr:hypothetical protein KAFR_0F01510 [Kazachstania africana CBS 2517]CCF58748.1 hypothetical protein KAFR_0F01510 [Kazachstania africana CBS 2517]